MSDDDLERRVLRIEVDHGTRLSALERQDAVMEERVSTIRDDLKEVGQEMGRLRDVFTKELKEWRAQQVEEHRSLRNVLVGAAVTLIGVAITSAVVLLSAGGHV